MNRLIDNLYDDIITPMSKTEKVVRGLLALFFVAFLAFELTFFLVFNLVITDQESMRETLQDGQKMIVQRVNYSYTRGDIVILEVDDKYLVKRAVALPDDDILFMRDKDNNAVFHVYVRKSNETSFTLADETHIREDMVNSVVMYGHAIADYNANYFTDDFTDDSVRLRYKGDMMRGALIEVDGVFCLGDNRNVSVDSRYYGAFDPDSVIGKVVAILGIDSAADRFLSLFF